MKLKHAKFQRSTSRKTF